MVKRLKKGLHTIENAIENAIERSAQCLPETPKGLALAVSGGLDSMVLMYEVGRWARARGWDLCVLHVNYGLRGEESEGDAVFVRQQAEAQGLACQVLEAQKEGVAPGAGIQVWARAVRRRWFQDFIARGWVVALAHHEDDWAETILMRMSRGASVMGMLGLRAFHEGIWRPLLGVARTGLWEIADRKKIPHREDSSNAKLDYARNRIRHHVLHELSELYPGAAHRIVELAQEAEGLRQYALQAYWATQRAREAVDVASLAALPNTMAWHVLGAWWRGSPLPQSDDFLNREGLRRLRQFVDDAARGGVKTYPVDDLWDVHVANGFLVAQRKGIGPQGPRFEQHRKSLAQKSYVFNLPAESCLSWSHGDDESWNLILEHASDGPSVTVELADLSPRDELILASGACCLGQDVMRQVVGGLTHEIIKINVDNEFWGFFYQGELFSWGRGGRCAARTDGKIAIRLLKNS